MRTVDGILASLDEKPAGYLAAARELSALPGTQLRTVNLFVLASFTFDLITPYVIVEGARAGLAVNVKINPFAQLEQQVLDPESDLARSPADVVVVATRVEELAPQLVDDVLRMSASALEQEVAAYVSRLVRIARGVRARTDARVLVWNQTPMERLAAGLADGSLDVPQQELVVGLNRKLQAAAREIPGVAIFDAARVATEVGTTRWFDRKLQLLARCPLSRAAQLAIGKRTARQLGASFAPPRKCLVLDLDNTLWGGVLGEEGVTGVALGEDFPGSAFKLFQRALRSYRDRGVLLAIASKNNVSDVDEMFATSADMVLQREDFAAVQVHWQDKAQSLRAIARELNIGTDSLAFFDDNPVERAWVREQLPEVFVVEVPADPSRFVDALDDSGAFDHLHITSEDRARASEYQAQQRRRQLEVAAGSLDEFLAALEMKLTIGPVDLATMPRVVQLINKTNQFNLTTRRYSETELAAIVAAEGTIALWMRVQDRFGDHGLIAVALARPEGRSYRLDTFLMSCRVLGRKLEYALIERVVEHVRRAGAAMLYGEFVPTKKNAPAAAFLSDAGFVAVPDRAGWWRRDVMHALASSTFLEVHELHE
jgi:FkbH-like protein